MYHDAAYIFECTVLPKKESLDNQTQTEVLRVSCRLLCPMARKQKWSGLEAAETIVKGQW